MQWVPLFHPARLHESGRIREGALGRAGSDCTWRPPSPVLLRTSPDQSQPAHPQACIPQTWAEGDLVHPPDFCHLQGCFGDSHGGCPGWAGRGAQRVGVQPWYPDPSSRGCGDSNPNLQAWRVAPLPSAQGSPWERPGISAEASAGGGLQGHHKCWWQVIVVCSPGKGLVVLLQGGDHLCVLVITHPGDHPESSALEGWQPI